MNATHAREVSDAVERVPAWQHDLRSFQFLGFQVFAGAADDLIVRAR